MLVPVCFDPLRPHFLRVHLEVPRDLLQAEEKFGCRFEAAAHPRGDEHYFIAEWFELLSILDQRSRKSKFSAELRVVNACGQLTPRASRVSPVPRLQTQTTLRSHGHPNPSRLNPDDFVTCPGNLNEDDATILYTQAVSGSSCGIMGKAFMDLLRAPRLLALES